MISFFVVNLTVFANIETASFKKFSFINKREISFEISSLKFNFYQFNTFCFEIYHSFVLSIDHEIVPYIPFAILTLIINDRFNSSRAQTMFNPAKRLSSILPQ